MPLEYDAIVIGTGFGGAIAATKLVEKQKKILLLERGTWWITPEKLGKPPVSAKPPIPEWAKANNQPVQYWPRPNNRQGLLDLFASVRHAANHQGLYQYSMFKQAHVLTASGVGGGSLIYSNVTLRPKTEVLQGLQLNLADDEYKNAADWMAKYRGKLSRIVTKIPLPGKDVANLNAKEDYLYLDRSRALRDAARVVAQKRGVEIPWEPLPLSVIEFEPGEGTDSTKANTFCERQGRCLLGCLPAARHTLNKTLYRDLLSDPAKGATLMPLAEVRDIEKIKDGYRVRFRDHRDEGREKFATAEKVFLAAGTLGSTEILLRSRDSGLLPLGDQVGRRFSTNGDFGGFALNTGNSVHSTRGPINTCHIQVKVDGVHIKVEDCSIPEMFAAIASTSLGVLDNFFQREAFKAKMMLAWTTHVLPDLRDFFPTLPDTHDPNNYQTEAEMVSNLFFFNVMSQDDASGVFRLSDDKLDLDWDRPVAELPLWTKIEDLLKDLAAAMGQDCRYVPFPLWRGLASRRLIVTHPLGGCAIGADNSQGVVNEFGQVYDCSRPAGSRDVLPGLLVVDGSTIPGALAANPSLTISAQAFKAVAKALEPAVIAAAQP